MNKKIRNLNLETLLFFDAEFIRRNEELTIDSHECELYTKSLRNKETGEVPPFHEVNEYYKLNAALRPEFNRVVCISVGYIKDKVLYYKTIKGNQKEVVEKFYDVITKSGLTPCGHNVIGFDFPQIRLKAMESNVDMSLLNDRYNDSQKKPWNMSDAVMDTMEITKGTYFYNISLDSLCMMLGIGSPKDDISGVDVSRVYYEEKDGLSRISKYCEKDVISLAEVMCALTGNKGYIEDFVCKNEAQEVIEEQPLLERIYLQNEIMEHDKKELLELIGRKRMSKKAKEMMIELVHSLSVNSDLFEGDKKEVIEEKRERVEEILKGL